MTTTEKSELDIDLAEIIATTIRDHSLTTGMQVASGSTCRCGYWNGNERAGKDRPVGCGGLTWHQAQEAATNIRAALEGASYELVKLPEPDPQGCWSAGGGTRVLVTSDGSITNGYAIRENATEAQALAAALLAAVRSSTK
jgi:hypothetical protein